MTQPSALDGLDQVGQREHSVQKKAGGLADQPQDPKVLRLSVPLSIFGRAAR